jgi:hypothetical protein
MAPPQGPEAFPVTSEAFAVRAEIDLDAVYGRLLNEARRLLTDYSQQGLAGQELADAVDAGLRGLSDTPIDRAARGATTEAFNLGRNLAAQRNQAGIATATRSEILDDATCDPCRLLDGTVVALNTPEYFELMPPNACDGRELCRGFYVYGVGA